MSGRQYRKGDLTALVFIGLNSTFSQRMSLAVGFHQLNDNLMVSAFTEIKSILQSPVSRRQAQDQVCTCAGGQPKSAASHDLLVIELLPNDRAWIIEANAGIRSGQHPHHARLSVRDLIWGEPAERLLWGNITGYTALGGTGPIHN